MTINWNSRASAAAFLWVVVTVFAIPSNAQSKYWIEFRDKGIHANRFIPGNRIFEETYNSLSQKCLHRRALALHEAEIKTITIEDAPISPRYVASLRALGIQAIVQSKWSNAVSAKLTHAQLNRVLRLSFVRSVLPVRSAGVLSIQPVSSPNGRTAVSNRRVEPLSDSICGYDPIIYHYGPAQAQLDRINVWPLHAMGFDGSGVLLGFLDVGFKWRENTSFQRLHVLSEYDYIFHDSVTENQSGDDPGQDEHGTQTLSVAMGYLPDTIVGPAYNATVMLAKTEDVRSEKNIEEDNYAAALEDMEARGVEITSSSLGYFTFDSGQHSYTYADMNGHTAICTQAAQRAATLGVLVVTAMGNSGVTDHPHLSAPADAENILGVGALDVNDSLAGFSSRGPTSDGRIKPDICAPGILVWALNAEGVFGGNDGTSYATPLTSGSCCLIKQVHPEATAQEIRRAIMTTGSNAANPDTAYGWGKLNVYAAALELGTIIHVKEAWQDTAIHICAGIASKQRIESVALSYFGDSDINPRSAQFNLVADSLIYACSIPFVNAGMHLYYRIVATDRSGATSVFPPSGWNLLSFPQSSVAQATSSSISAQAFPNPCSSGFELTLSAPGHWQLMDLLGRTIISARVIIPATTHIETATLPAGVYHLEFTSSGGETKTIPLIVAH